jgi:hypothetical protein
MKKFNFILLIFSLISCSDIKDENLQKSLVTISIKPDFSSAINFIKDTTFIPLEFCEDCIIGNISKVLKVPDGFIISDKTITKQILKFGNDGKFLFKVGNQGEGLGNYILPFDISLIPNTNHLAVLDQNQNKFIFYDLETGNFIEEVSVYFQAKSFYFLDSTTVALHNDGNFSGLERDNLGAILSLEKNEYLFKGVNDFPKTDQNLTGGDFLEGAKGALFSKSLNDTIYTVNHDGFFPKYKLDFGDKAVKEELKKKPLMEMFEEMMKTTPYYHNGNIIENTNYLFYLWWADDPIEKFSWYNKVTKVNSSMNGEEVIFKRPFYINEDYLVAYLTNADFEQMEIEPNFGLSENQTLVKITFK